MSSRLDTEAEILKIARLLGATPEDLAYLEPVGPDTLVELRVKLTDRLYDGGAVAFGRVAAASKRLPPPFLADVTAELDPRRVAAIISKVPVELVAAVAGELGRRREYVTMGRFLAVLPDPGVRAAMAALDDEALVRTAFVLEDKSRLDNAVGLLPADRMAGVLATASQHGLWPQALDLLDHLSEARRGPVADKVAELDDTDVAGLVQAVAEADLWEALLPILDTMDRGVLLSLVDSADHSFGEQLLTAITASGKAAALLAQLPDDVRAGVEHAADRTGLRSQLDEALAK